MTTSDCREVDRKREELRVMVGERYRDLIEAADTIHQMRDCTSSVMRSLKEMQGACSDLQRAEQVDQWPQSRPEYVRSGQTAHLGVAASVKLLTVLPEQIWAGGEAGDWSGAAGLYLLGQHVYTGLQGDQGSGVSPLNIAQWYPVISRQWDVLQQLYASLMVSCEAQLSVSEICGEGAADCMTAMMMVSNKSQTECLTRTLQLRLAGLRGLVTSCRTESAVRGVSSLAQYVQSSIQSLESCLVSGGLNSRLQSLATSNLNTLSVIPPYILGPTAKYLPQPIQEFKPKISERQLTTIEDKVLRTAVKSWLDNVLEVAGAEIRSMLQFVSSVESLKRLQEAVLEIVGEERLSWAGDVSVWELIFRGIISERMIEIVTSQLELMMEETAGDVESLIAEEEESLDFIWTDNSAEIGEVWGKGKSEKVGLRLKCSGWSVRLQEICTRLDSALDRLRHCLESDREILAHCSLYTSKTVVKLLAEICEEGKERPVLRCRVSQALLELTTNLTRLLGDRAADLKQVIEEKQKLLLTKWSQTLLSSLSVSLLTLTPDSSLTSLPVWDKVNIAESGDSGEEVTSVINIPATPSLPLLSALLKLSSDIHSHQPTSLPSYLLSLTKRGAVSNILHHYAQIAINTLTQNFALQLLFDIHFTETLLVSREDKETFLPSIHQIVSSLESNIDPFDLSVFSPHMEERVKRSCARLVWGLACLVPSDRLPVISSYKNVHSDNHNILNISAQSCPRFQLLALAPLPMKSLETVHTPSSDLTSHSISNKSTRTDKNFSGTFFGSMSWFGNN